MAEVTEVKAILSQKKPRRVVERNTALFGEVMRYLLDKPIVFVRLKSGRTAAPGQLRPGLYVPLAV